MTDGRLILNGKYVDFKEDGKFIEIMERQGSMGRQPRCANAPVGLGGVCEKDRGIETLPSGKSYSVLNIGNQGSDNTGVYTVPEGHYFLSVTIGTIQPIAAFVKIIQIELQRRWFCEIQNNRSCDRIMFSSAGKSMFFFWTWRSDRFLKEVI